MTDAPAAAEPTREEGRRSPSTLRRMVRLGILPAMAILLALVVGALVMIASSPLVRGSLDLGLPLTAYGALLSGSFGSVDAIINTLVQATPLILAGLAVGIGFKAGLFNIGAQGQFLMGGLAAAAVGVATAGLPPIAAIPLALLAGVAAGFAYGFIPGFLKAFTGAHEVVTTIMLNYVAIQIIAYVVSGPLRGENVSFARTETITSAALPVLAGRNGHIGIAFALVAVPIIAWLLFRSTLGFEIRTVGANPEAARYAGMRPRLLTILTMAISGLLAGLAGATVILGTVGHIPAAYATGVGFDAIAVALLGRSHPVGILFAGLLFGAMRAGSGLMQIQAGIPVQMVNVLQAVILFFLTAELIVRYLFRVRAESAEISELKTITSSYGTGQAVK
ncbi:MAG TPA: ABC transporter permease [Candidatus Limnocylindria bacterium]|nr:ABC transporter permease [Candidatus Limnocylindria bacterium]